MYEKAKTLSIGGRLTLLKSVLGASPLYNMSIYKVPRGVLKSMEAIRSKFFNGADYSDKKITWAAWDKVLASKKNGGLAHMGWYCTRFWYDNWICDKSLRDRFPRLFALEMEKEVSVAVEMGASVVDSFRKAVRDETKRHQMLGPNSMLESVSLSSAQDRWICDLFGDGEFRVQEVRNILDDLFLPAQLNSTRWVKLEQVVAIVKSCSPNAIGDLTVIVKDLSSTIPETLHQKVIGDGDYEIDITVGAAMILANVSVLLLNH
nr:RNA-directed DNA polymerase, eukaryota, reverse transcriptase zinc-binding domain protein [Tanacetum cinerariifolium]